MLVVGLVVGLVAAAASACSPVPRGTSALMVDDDGGLVTIVRTCSAKVDRVELRQAVLGVGTEDIELSRVRTDIGEDSSQTVSMGVLVDDLDATLLLRTFPHAEGAYDRVASVTFDVATLRSLAPTDVLVGDRTPVSLEEFTDAPCQGAVWPAPTASGSSSPSAG